MEEHLFNRTRNPDEEFGIYIQSLRAISLHPGLRKNAYGGGTASALTYAALSEGFVDAAIICSWGYGEPWRPGPRIIRHSKDVHLGLGSKYFPSPNLTALNELSEDEEALFVGLPCHILALRRMQQAENSQVRRLASKVKVILGAFCGIPSLLTAESFASYLERRGVSLTKIKQVSTVSTSISQGVRSYRVHLREGYVDVPVFRLLGELSSERIRCDSRCFDYSADLADISVGGSIPPEIPTRNLSNALFVRTRIGEALVKLAQDANILHTRSLGKLGLMGLKLFPPYRRKRSKYLSHHRQSKANAIKSRNLEE
jgi:coenzyme F420-reducing hydrogenase beta subunit